MFHLINLPVKIPSFSCYQLFSSSPLVYPATTSSLPLSTLSFPLSFPFPLLNNRASQTAIGCGAACEATGISIVCSVTGFSVAAVVCSSSFLTGSSSCAGFRIEVGSSTIVGSVASAVAGSGVEIVSVAGANVTCSADEVAEVSSACEG